jgi:hypothetical protein
MGHVRGSPSGRWLNGGRRFFRDLRLMRRRASRPASRVNAFVNSIETLVGLEGLRAAIGRI